jgi:hypothetical protein
MTIKTMNVIRLSATNFFPCDDNVNLPSDRERPAPVTHSPEGASLRRGERHQAVIAAVRPNGEAHVSDLCRKSDDYPTISIR